MDPEPLSTPTAPRSHGLVALLRDHTFRSLKTRNYRLYFLGQIVSFTGSWMQNAALMWLVFADTTDPLWPPLLLVAQVGPTLLLGTYGGSLADRLPKRGLIFATQCGFLANACVLATLVLFGGADPMVVFALQVVSGVIQSVDLPARLAFVPDLVPRADLINAVSLNSLLFNSARAIGPALAGGLFLLAAQGSDFGWWPANEVVRAGALGCFGLNIASYAAVLVALRRIDVNPVGREAETGGSVWDGFRYILAHRHVGGLLLFTGLLSVFGWPALSLFPAYTKFALGHSEKEYSVLVSAIGMGAFLAAFANATFGTIGRRGLFLSVGAGLTATGLALLSLVTELPDAMLSAGCLGFGLILFLSTGQSSVQLGVPDEVRGRVMALWAMTLSASAPLGHLVAGAAAQAWPVRDVLTALAIGAATIACGVVAIVLHRNRTRR